MQIKDKQTRGKGTQSMKLHEDLSKNSVVNFCIVQSFENPADLCDVGPTVWGSFMQIFFG